MQFKEDLSESMEGVKRLSSHANKHGEGNIYNRDRSLPWSLYEQFNKWFIEDGSEDGIFAASFSKLTCVLECHGKSTGQICTKQLKWLEDSYEIQFGHIKDNQTSKNPIKKQGRNSYCNPYNLHACSLTAVFDYMALNPDIISNTE